MFKRLQKLSVADATSWMDELPPAFGPEARIQLKPAGEDNKMYYNALLRLSGKRIRRQGRAVEIDAEMLEENREDDRVLFPKYVIINWEGILDDDGNEVAYSQDHAQELVDQIPNWLFDRIRTWANTPERFLDRDEALPNAGELAGNLENVSAMS